MVNISLTYWGKFKRNPILNDKLLLNMLLKGLIHTFYYRVKLNPTIGLSLSLVKSFIRIMIGRILSFSFSTEIFRKIMIIDYHVSLS